MCFAEDINYRALKVKLEGKGGQMDRKKYKTENKTRIKRRGGPSHYKKKVIKQKLKNMNCNYCYIRPTYRMWAINTGK